MDAEKIRLAEEIDAWAQGVEAGGGGDEQLLAGMVDYMGPFKRLLDSCSSLEMQLLIQRYDGFYRVSQLLEQLAAAIADGVIDVPGGRVPPKSKAARKKRPRKPKPRRHQKKQPQQIPHEISKLPLFTEMIIGAADATEEQWEAFMAAKDKPHVLDDATIDRGIRLCQAQVEDIAAHDKQLGWWLEEDMSDAQRYQVNDLRVKLLPWRERNLELLDLLAELRTGTIDRILEMDDEELGRRFRDGELGAL